MARGAHPLRLSVFLQGQAGVGTPLEIMSDVTLPEFVRCVESIKDDIADNAGCELGHLEYLANSEGRQIGEDHDQTAGVNLPTIIDAARRAQGLYIVYARFGLSTGAGVSQPAPTAWQAGATLGVNLKVGALPLSDGELLWQSCEFGVRATVCKDIDDLRGATIRSDWSIDAASHLHAPFLEHFRGEPPDMTLVTTEALYDLKPEVRGFVNKWGADQVRGARDACVGLVFYLPLAKMFVCRSKRHAFVVLEDRPASDDQTSYARFSLFVDYPITDGLCRLHMEAEKHRLAMLRAQKLPIIFDLDRCLLWAEGEDGEINLRPQAAEVIQQLRMKFEVYVNTAGTPDHLEKCLRKFEENRVPRAFFAGVTSSRWNCTRSGHKDIRQSLDFCHDPRFWHLATAADDKKSAWIRDQRDHVFELEQFKGTSAGSQLPALCRVALELHSHFFKHYHNDRMVDLLKYRKWYMENRAVHGKRKRVEAGDGGSSGGGRHAAAERTVSSSPARSSGTDHPAVSMLQSVRRSSGSRSPSPESQRQRQDLPHAALRAHSETTATNEPAYVYDSDEDIL
jgi:hypothetical protein